MNAIVAIIGGVIATVALLFVAVLMNTIVGGVVGWVVDMAFPFVTGTVNQLAGTTLTGFEVGAVLGFVGSFFRSTTLLKD